MNATPTLSRAVGDWLTVLMAAERAADAMRAEMDEQYQMLDDLDGLAAEPASLQATQARINPQLRHLNEHLASAQRSWEEVGAEMAAAEVDIRHWQERVSCLREQLSKLSTI